MKTHLIFIASLAICCTLSLSDVFGLNVSQTMILNDCNYKIPGERNFQPYFDVTMEIIGTSVFMFYTDRNGDGSDEATLRKGWFEKDTPVFQTMDWGYRNPPTRLFSPQMKLTPDSRVHLAFSQYYAAVESSEVIYQCVDLSGGSDYARHVSGMLTHTRDLSLAMTFQHCSTDTDEGRYAAVMVYDAHGLYNHYDHNIFYQREVQICDGSNLFFWLNTHEVGKYYVSECIASSVDWCPAADYDNTNNKCHIVWDSRNSIGFSDNPCTFPMESCVIYTAVGQLGNKMSDQLVFEAQLHEANSHVPGTYYHNPMITTCGSQEMLCLALEYIYRDGSAPPVEEGDKRIQTNRIVYDKTDKTQPNWSSSPSPVILTQTQSTSDNLISDYKFIWKDADRNNGYLIYSNGWAYDLWLVKYVNGVFETTKTRLNTDLNINPWTHSSLDARYDSSDNTIKMCVVSGWDEDTSYGQIYILHSRIDYLVISDL